MTTETGTQQHLYSRPPLDPNAEDSLAKIARRIPHDSTVLDVGCAVGVLGQYLTEQQNCSVDGIEGNVEAAKIARPFYRRIMVTDLESADLRQLMEGARYDRIVCADVLEHLRDPGQVLQRLKDHLTPDGKILISIPNIGHIGVFLELLSGDFRYREEGLLDRTHLRFFTRRSFLYLLAENGFAGQVVDRTIVDLQYSEFSTIPMEIISPSLLREMQDWDDSITYQFIVEAYPQELGENVTPIFPLDKAVSHGPRFACQVFWHSNDELFTETRSERILLPIGLDRQRVSFTFPKGLVQALRFDPSDWKGFLRLYAMRLLDGTDCLWTWDGDVETLLRGTLHSILPAPLKTGEVGAVLSLLDEDPWLELPVPSEILSRAEHLEVELSWPMSADYLAVQDEWEVILKKNQRLATELEAMHQSNEVRTSELTAALQAAEEQNQRLATELEVMHQSNEVRTSELTAALQAVEEQNQRLATELEAILRSHSWKLTKPLRITADTLRASIRASRLLLTTGKQGQEHRYAFARTLYHRTPLPGRVKRVLRNLAKRPYAKRVTSDYHKWISKYDTLTKKNRADMREHIASFVNPPVFSVVMPTYNPPEKFLRKAIESVRAQIYPHWELCIVDDASPLPHVRRILDEYACSDQRIHVVFRKENGHISKASNEALGLATGDHVVLLDHDDMLAEHALYWIASEIMRHPDADVIYSDEDHIDEAGVRNSPFFKPDWSPHLAVSQAYIGHLVCLSSKVIAKLKVGGNVFDPSMDGSQDYDLWLRAANMGVSIYHVPKILYHWREHEDSTAKDVGAKPYAVEAGRNAVLRYVNARYPGNSIDVVHGRDLLTYALDFSLPETLLISIVIPTRNGLDLLRKCVDSIISRSSWRQFEIIIVDNGSDDAATIEYLQRIQLLLRCVRVIRADEPFNWSRLNNIAAEEASGDVLVFLNNDTIVISENWLQSLAGYALLPDVATVGALLLFEDGYIQHSGVVVGMGGWANHVFHNLAPEHRVGPFVSPVLTRNVLAVTGACLAVERKKFVSLGKFDDEFIICGSDVELGLRAHREGYFNVICAEARLYHLESKTRNPDKIPDSDFIRSDLKYAPYRTELVDPFFNPNLDLQITKPTLKE